MDKSIDNVKQYYDSESEQEWERLEKHKFEFILTTYMMDKYIKPGDKILDIGGGPGRYSLYYAEKGCNVTLIDLSDGNINIAKKKAEEKGVNIHAIAKNCLEINELNLEEFDHVFLMGPLYHLINEDDRIKAVKIALNHLKTGGNLYVSFILCFAAMIYDMKNGPGLLPLDLGLYDNNSNTIVDALEKGENYIGQAFTSACFYNQRNIEPFMQQFNIKKLHLFGQEGILSPCEDKILSYSEDEIKLWINSAIKLIEFPELLSYSEHAMYIAKK